MFLPASNSVHEMKYAISSASLRKGVAIVGVVVGVPVAVVRGVVNFPSTLVDAIAKFAAER